MVRRIAFIPWSKEFMNDNMFNLNSSLNRDNCFMMWVGMKNYLQENNWEVHTVDVYEDIRQVDIFVFFSFFMDWYSLIRKFGLEDKTIYIAFEPPVVDKNHTEIGIGKLLHYFKYVLTWNDDLIDNKRIFKFMYPYAFFDVKKKISFEQRNLLVNISGNKTSDSEGELYSERRKVIQYFDGYEGFSLFGSGWEKENFNSYKGQAQSKEDTYAQYKFALCLENMTNIKGYITEKILDCFCSGIVPIYLGASNMTEYIPDECYIHYDQFSDLDELKVYLEGMKKEDYEKYLDESQKYLESKDKDIFLPEKLGETISSIANLNDGYVFRANRSIKICRYKKLLKKMNNSIRGIIHRLHKNKGNTQIDEKTFIGEYTYIGRNCLISRATIGRYCSIGNNVSIGPGEHRLNRISTSSFLYDHKVDWYSELTREDVNIGNDVWIGTDSIIRRGVTIGNGAVVGANSFVNKDVPPFAIVAGNPAKIIRYRFDEKKIKEIQDSKWWMKDLDNARHIVSNLEKD